MCRMWRRSWVLLILLAAVCTPRLIACTHAAIEQRMQSAAMREAAWVNAVAAEETAAHGKSH